MREKKFTAGPWTVMAHGAITLIYGNTERCDRVAKIMIMDKNGVRKANAALISAAPELLEALEGAKWAIEEMLKLDTFNDIWDVAGKREATDIELKMQTAIAKAYGEKP